MNSHTYIYADVYNLKLEIPKEFVWVFNVVDDETEDEARKH